MVSHSCLLHTDQTKPNRTERRDRNRNQTESVSSIIKGLPECLPVCKSECAEAAWGVSGGNKRLIKSHDQGAPQRTTEVRWGKARGGGRGAAVRRGMQKEIIKISSTTKVSLVTCLFLSGVHFISSTLQGSGFQRSTLTLGQNKATQNKTNTTNNDTDRRRHLNRKEWTSVCFLEKGHFKVTM